MKNAKRKLRTKLQRWGRRMYREYGRPLHQTHRQLIHHPYLVPVSIFLG
jgi:hypothetical protein